jgi:hypothetical protein
MKRESWWPKQWGQPFSNMPGKAARAVSAYNRWTAEHYSRFDLEGLAGSVESIALRDIYVPLMFGEKSVDENESVNSDSLESRIHKDGIDVLRMLAKTSTVLLSGLPGSGKTTLVRHMTWSLCADTPNDFNTVFPDYLVLPLLLRECDIDGAQTMANLIGSYMQGLRNEIGSGFIAEDLNPFFETGRFILLLDGLDELGNLERRQKVLSLSAPIVRSMRNPHQGSKWIVTSRPSGLEALFNENEEREERSVWSLKRNNFHVLPFSMGQVKTFVDKWFQMPTYRERAQRTESESLMRAINEKERVDLRQLSRRPAFLTLISFIQATVGRLPDTREALYRQLVDAYVHTLDEKKRLDEQKGKTQGLAQPSDIPTNWQRDEKVQILARLGWIGQMGGTRRLHAAFMNRDRRLVWRKEELQNTIRETIENEPSRFRTARPEHAAALMDYFLSRTGLLVEIAEHQIQFGHLSFQEYLAALHLHDAASSQGDKAAFVKKVLFEKLGQQGWDEVATLFMAIDAQKTGGRGHPLLLKELDLTQPRHARQLAGLLGGRELSFSEEERDLLVGAVSAAGIALGDSGSFGQALGREPRNAQSLWLWTSLLISNESIEQTPLECFFQEIERRRVSVVRSNKKGSFDDFGLEETSRGVSPEECALELCINAASAFQRNKIARGEQIATACILAAQSNLRTPFEMDSEPFRRLLTAIPSADKLFSFKEVSDLKRGLEISDAWWAFNSLVPHVEKGSFFNTRFSNRLLTETHMAVWFCMTPQQVPSWILSTSRPAILIHIEQTLSIVCSTVAATQLSLQKSLQWITNRRQNKIVSSADERESLINQNFDGVSNHVREFLARNQENRTEPAWSSAIKMHNKIFPSSYFGKRCSTLEFLMRSVQYISGQPRAALLRQVLEEFLAFALSIEQAINPERKTGDGSTTIMPMIQQLSWARQRAEWLVFVGPGERGREKKAPVRLSEEEVDHFYQLLFYFGMASESLLIDSNINKTITEKDLYHALQTFSNPNWLTDPNTPYGERLRREWRECKEMGLFPTEIVEEALKDTKWLETKPTLLRILEHVADEIQEFLAKKIGGRSGKVE